MPIAAVVYTREPLKGVLIPAYLRLSQMLPHYQQLPFVKRVTLDECNRLMSRRQRVSSSLPPSNDRTDVPVFQAMRLIAFNFQAIEGLQKSPSFASIDCNYSPNGENQPEASELST